MSRTCCARSTISGVTGIRRHSARQGSCTNGCHRIPASRLPAAKRRRLTLDNGREFARPAELERTLAMPIYFVHPYHSWERGTNENANGLLRQYLPKGVDFTDVHPQQLRGYVHALNHRPRKCLGFHSPFEVFHGTSAP